MTKEEFIAKRFASLIEVEKQDNVIYQLRREHDARLEEALKEPHMKLTKLQELDNRQHADALPLLDFLPFKRGNFVTRGNGSYFQVSDIDVTLRGVDVSWTQPPHDFLRLRIKGFEIRKSGTLARYWTSLPLDNDPPYRKADVSEALCLRRALKQKMRKRLEGGN